MGTIKEYMTYHNEDGTRALSVNPRAEGGVFLKLSSTNPNGHNQLGSMVIAHGDLPHFLFEMTGGSASDEDFAEAKAIADSIRDGVDATQASVATAVRRLLLALHLHINAPAKEAPAKQEEPREGCNGCRATDEAYEDAERAPETLQDPDYDHNAEELDVNEVPDTSPNIVAALAAENASLRNKLKAIQALTNPHVNL